MAEIKPLATTEKPMPVRHVAAVTVGNALAFFDFVTYSFFAVYIGRTFFPMRDASLGLLLSLATFGVGFLTRPIGAIVIGSMGDRVGRKPAMVLSFALMGFAIVGLALTPSYARIGIAAPIVAITFRLLQGFALGGEVGPTTAYMVEAAPALKRGYYASLQAASQDAAVLLAGIIATSLAAVLDAQALQDWGWRLTMLVGASIVPFGLMLRRSLPETLHRANDTALAPGVAAEASSMTARLRPYLLLIVLGLMIFAAGTIASYSGNYMTTYALTTLHLEARIAFGVIIVNGGVSVIFDIASGVLSDRFGRKPVMVIPGIVLLLSVLPAFWLIGAFRSTLVFYAAMGWLSALAALANGPIIVLLTESLPRNVRAGAISTIYAFAIAIFGGSTQVIIKLLLDATRNPLAPAYYWTAAGAIGLVAMLLVTESAPAKLAARSQYRT